MKRTLGCGGQGTAYLAEDREGNQIVLKEYILPVFVDAKARRQAVDMFRHETDVLRRIRHESIVQLQKAFVEDNRAYLVLEFVNGRSLKESVSAGAPMSEAETIAYAIAMCDILSYLHNLTPPVVHRDFTPDNLILTENGQIKLIDFMVAQDSSDMNAMSVVGKHAYMPPEQLRGKATVQSDIYALGGTLFYLLTGMDPEAISQSRPSLFNSNVGLQLDDVIARCTSLEAHERYHCAEEVKRDLLECARAAA